MTVSRSPALDHLRRLAAQLDQLRTHANGLRDAYDVQCKLVAALYQPDAYPPSGPWLDAACHAQRLWDEYDAVLLSIYRIRMAHAAKEHRGQMRLHRIQSRRR
jgi:hypothetical protein